MTTTESLHTLAARVERLTEPDRAVDAEIACACAITAAALRARAEGGDRG